MASDREERNYSSPPKRLKLDDSAILCTSSIEIDKVAVSASFKSSETSPDDDLGFNSGTLNICEEENNLVFDPVHDRHISDDVVGLVDDEDDDDDVSSTVSNLSDLSGLSDMSGQDWKPMAGPMSWVQKQMLNGVNPRTLLGHLMGDTSHVPTQVDDLTLWKIIVNMLSEPPRRSRLRHINSLKDVVSLLKTCSRIIVLTGAGVSVSCGIPDFRSRDGIYSRLAVDFPHLPDPQAMFDINYFRQDPRPFFKFAKEIYPGQFKPSPCHRFIKMLEKQKKLLRNYSQNIDTLEKAAGIENVVECHGSFATASCTVCGHKMTSDGIRTDVFEQKIPLCPVCPPGSEASRGVMKPDIVFFGEGLPESFHTAMAKDKDICDLLIVIGTSLKVRPVALIPSSIPNSVPQILINRERLPHLNFDVELLGDSDAIIDQLCRMLGDEWSEVCWRNTPLTETEFLLAPQCRSGYGTECSEGEGEMSVDSTRDSGLGRINSVDDLGLPVRMDSRMEEVMDDNSQSSVSDSAHSVCASADRSDNNCASCRNSVAVKCKKIRRNHVQNKDVTAEAHRIEDCITNGELELVSGGRMSIEQEEVELDNGRGECCLVTRRHLSLDSTRDSGIGDGSNSSHSAERHMSVDSQLDIPSSLASRLPENTYFFVRPNRYIFPGAEVMDDTDDDDDRSTSDCSDLGSETQHNSWFCQNQLPPS